MGVIFINLSADGEDFADFIGPLEQRWTPFMGSAGVSQLTPSSAQGAIEIEVAANWKLAVENYCEAYHLPWVHPALNSYSPLDKHYNIIAADNMSGQGSLAYTLCEVAGHRTAAIRGLAARTIASRRIYFALPPMFCSACKWITPLP